MSHGELGPQPECLLPPTSGPPLSRHHWNCFQIGFIFAPSAHGSESHTKVLQITASVLVPILGLDICSAPETTHTARGRLSFPSPCPLNCLIFPACQPLPSSNPARWRILGVHCRGGDIQGAGGTLQGHVQSFLSSSPLPSGGMLPSLTCTVRWLSASHCTLPWTGHTPPFPRAPARFRGSSSDGRGWV